MKRPLIGVLLTVLVAVAGCTIPLGDDGSVTIGEDNVTNVSTDAPNTQTDTADDSPEQTTGETTTQETSTDSDSTSDSSSDSDTTTETKARTDTSEQTTDDSGSDPTTDTPADGDTEPETPTDSPPIDDEVDSFTTQCGDTTFRLAEIGQRIDSTANETVIHYEVTNTGNATAENVTLLLQGEMPLSVVEETVSLGTIEPDETVSGTEAIAGTHDDGEGGPADISCESSSEQNSNSESNESTDNETEPSGDDSDEQLSTIKQCGDNATVRIYESAQIVDHDANRTYVDFEVINVGNTTAENVTVKVVAEDPDGAITETVTAGKIAPGATKVGTVPVPGTHDDGEANPYLLSCSAKS